MIDLSANEGWLQTTLEAMSLVQMCVQGLWSFDSSLLTLPHVQESHIELLNNKSKTKSSPLTVPPPDQAMQEKGNNNETEAEDSSQSSQSSDENDETSSRKDNTGTNASNTGETGNTGM